MKPTLIVSPAGSERHISLDDYSGLHEYRKEKRNKWEKVFLTQYLDRLKEKYEVSFKMNAYLIHTKDWNTLKYYPKSQSLYFPNSKYWLKKYGLKWIKENLFKG